MHDLADFQYMPDSLRAAAGTVDAYPLGRVPLSGGVNAVPLTNPTVTAFVYQFVSCCRFVLEGASTQRRPEQSLVIVTHGASC